MENREDQKYIYSLVSSRIKSFRKYRGITQEKLADMTTFSKGFIGNIESVRTEQTFSLAVLYSFARALDIPMELFVKDNIDDELKKLKINLEEARVKRAPRKKQHENK